jgi:hypothetical protein
MRNYRELSRLKTFDERFEYLKIGGLVGESTFGFERYLNQTLYNSSKWRRLRNQIIIRDNGCDLGAEGYEIQGIIIVHHMNPISVDDLKDFSDDIFNPEYLICVSLTTHNAIHYGDKSLIPQEPVERRPGDTCPWRE